MSTKLKTHGTTQFNSPKSEIEGIVEEIKINGYAVVDSVFSKEKIEYLTTSIDQIYQKQIDEIIHEINPNLKFQLRQHGNDSMDLVLYAFS